MKTLQNNFTTPEQSKRLLELGLPADSADMFWSATYLNGKKDGYLCAAVAFVFALHDDLDRLSVEAPRVFVAVVCGFLGYVACTRRPFKRGDCASVRDRRRARAFGVREDMHVREWMPGQEPLRRGEVEPALVGEPHHQVAAEAYVGHELQRDLRKRADIPGEVRTFHRHENAVCAGLCRNVQEPAGVRTLRHRVNAF